MENNRHTSEIKWLRPSQVKVDIDTYQREATNQRVKKILDDWNYDLVNMPKVSMRIDGSLYAFDGQATLKAWGIHESDAPIKCLVFHGLSKEDEARLFVQQNGAASPVNTRDKMRAQYNIGEPEIVEMVNAAKSAGIELRLTNSTGGDGRCHALAACKRSVQRIGLWQFQQALDTIVQAWGGVQESLSNGFIDGMTEIYATNQTQFDKKELIKKLSQFPPSYYIRESKEYTGSKGKRFASVFRKVYNRNRRVNVLGA